MGRGPQIVQVKDINLGGLADSEYQGIGNSLSKIVGCDVHSTPGLIKVAQKLTLDSGATIDEFVKNLVACSDGSTYMFSSTSGKIWKRTSAGVYSLEATNANGACLGASEFEGYVYYATATKLGRWQIGTAWSTRTDSFATFTNGDILYKPFFEKNGVLYIGDGNLIAQVESGAFVADALDIEGSYRTSLLGPIGEALLIGTTVSSNVKKNKAYVWDTWSVSWAQDSDVYEDGLNAFIPLANSVVVQAGSKGNIYAHDGASLTQIKKIPGDYSGTNKMKVNPTASIATDINTLIGVSNVSGNPCYQGVYGYGGYSAGYPKILTLDYIISTANVWNVEIGSICPIDNGFLVSWKDNNVGGPTYGVDNFDSTAKFASAYIESRLYSFDRSVGKTVYFLIPYRSIPTGCNLTLQVYKNYGAPETLTLVQDTDRKFYRAEFPIDSAVNFKFKLAFTVSGNDAPEIEGINLTLS
jgi:hypothetical protein